jgi:hypothetical protein
MFEFGQTNNGRRSRRRDSNEPRTLKNTKDSKGPEKGDAAAEVSKKGRHSNRRTSNKPRGERKPKDSKNPVKGAAVAEVSLAIQGEQPAQDITTVQPSPPQAPPETTHKRIEYPHHPVTKLFPPMQCKEYEALKKDMQKNGQRVPCYLSQGQIIEGCHRDDVNRELGRPTWFQEWDGKGSLVDFVLSQNLHRRHLDESQRAMVAARAKPMYEEEARQRKRAGKAASDLPPRAEEGGKGEAAELAAAQFNVGRNIVYLAQKVCQDGTPELQGAVDSGLVSVAVAADVAGLPEEEQKEAVAKGKKALMAKAKEVRQQKADRKRKEADSRNGKTNRRSGPENGSQSVMATPAASPEGAPQASADAVSPVGQNAASPEPPAPEAPTAQSGGVAPERTDAEGPAPPEPELDREATNSIGSNSACPEPPAQDKPTTQTGYEAPERTDAVGPEPHEPKVDRKVLAELIAAWKQAGSSERRVFLNLLLDDVESKTHIRAVMCPQYQGQPHTTQ